MPLKHCAHDHSWSYQLLERLCLVKVSKLAWVQQAGLVTLPSLLCVAVLADDASIPLVHLGSGHNPGYAVSQEDLSTNSFWDHCTPFHLYDAYDAYDAYVVFGGRG